MLVPTRNTRRSRIAPKPIAGQCAVAGGATGALALTTGTRAPKQ